MAVTPYQEKKYVQSDAVTKAQQALQNQQAAKPGEYQSQWQGQLNDVLGQIQNRDKFQYDINADALYQQAAQRYIQQGQQAMMDTMGQAAALTGGYGNSYAQTAGQQTYQNYLLGLTDMIPQFQQMAMQQYQMEGDDLLNRYSLLAQQEESAYGRYNDMLSRYYAELDRLQGVYDSERDSDYGRFVDDRNFDYGKYMDELNRQYQQERDKVADDQWLQQLMRQQERDQIADSQWQQELAYQQERDRIADEKWQKEYEESIRQFNESMAARVIPEYVENYYDDPDYYEEEYVEGANDAMTLPMAAAQVAKQYSVEEAVDWINSQNESQATKNAAIQNAMGVAQTEYYRKMAQAMAKK